MIHMNPPSECPPSGQPAFFALEYDALLCPQADDYCVNAGPECGDSDQNAETRGSGIEEGVEAISFECHLSLCTVLIITM